MRILGEALNALILACSVQNVPVDIIMGIAITESNGYAYAVSGSYQHSNYYLLPKTEAEVDYAITVARESIKRDINISLGLMQLNSWHLDRMGASAEVAFDSCNNILLGTSVFKEITNRICADAFTDECLDSALRQYNTGRVEKSDAGDDYVGKVRANAPLLDALVLTAGRKLAQ